jgi:hypothetical protein
MEWGDDPPPYPPRGEQAGAAVAVIVMVFAICIAVWFVVAARGCCP